MNPRERWTIYPLLFLALGASLHDKLAPFKQFQNIQCEEITVVNSLGKPVVRLGSSPGKNPLQGEINGGFVQAADAAGVSSVIFCSTSKGGSLTALRKDKTAALTFGFDKAHTGVFLIDEAARQVLGAPLFPLQPPAQVVAPPAQPQPLPAQPPQSPNSATPKPNPPSPQPTPKPPGSQ